MPRKIYVGIDIGKFKHECCMVESDGAVVRDGFSFDNSRNGFESFGKELESVVGSEIAVIAFEATGHDGENAHARLIEALGGKQEIHKTRETKGMKDSENPLEAINALHRYLKKFMARHGPFARDLLQDWLSLFYMAFSSFGDPAVFVSRVLQRAINYKKVLRYRSVMGKKSR